LRRGYHEGLNSRRSDGRRKAALTDADRFEISPRPSDHLRKALEGHPSPWGTFSPFFPSVRTLGHFRREWCALDSRILLGLVSPGVTTRSPARSPTPAPAAPWCSTSGPPSSRTPPSNCVHVVTLLKMPPPQNYAPRVTIVLPKPPLSSSHSIYNIRQTACRPAASFNMVVPERPTRPAARPSTAAALRIQPSSFIWAQCYHSGSGLVPYRGFSHGCCRYTSQRSRMIQTRLQLNWLHPKRFGHG